MKGAKYKELEFYKIIREITITIYRETKKFPKEELGFTGIVNQLRRAIVSASSNIAEGSSRKEKEYLHFLSLSLGSLREVENQIGISCDLGFISKEIFEDINNKLNKSIAKLCMYYKIINKNYYLNKDKKYD